MTYDQPPQTADVPTQGRFYHPELDGLRFFAFFAVFVHHGLPNAARSWSPFVGDQLGELISAGIRAGAYGVDLFFCLSAFLITELLLREHERFGAISVKQFFIRRVLRIWPLYYVFLTFCVFIWPFYVPNSTISYGEIAAFYFVLGNWSCAFLGYPSNPIAPLWSVSIEEQFYLCWPMLLTALGVHRVRLLASLLAALAVCVRVYLVSVDSIHPAIWCNTFARLDAIAGGILLVLVLRRFPRRAAWVRYTALLAGCAALVAVSSVVQVDETNSASVWSYSVVAIACVAILQSIISAPSPLVRFLGHPVLVYLGRLSYSLYVTHVLCLAVARSALVGRVNGSALVVSIFVGALALTLLCSIISYYMIERPFLILKTGFARVDSRVE